MSGLIYVEFTVASEMFDAMTLFAKPNTKAGHLLLKADTTTDPTASMACGIILGHLMNQLPKDGKAYDKKGGS